MKLLLDQDVYAVTAKFLISLGMDVLTVGDLGMSTASDAENLRKSIELGRIFVTRDRDYGNLVFVNKIKASILYLRVLPSTISQVHAELKRALNLYSEEELAGAFIVIEADRHRFRHLQDYE
ncbi:MAG: DUF5615 family PIN-like protein [Pyrinomonadaceae bacterium]